jgi:hypothetical protein
LRSTEARTGACPTRVHPKFADDTPNHAISLLHLAGVIEITRTLQAIARDRNRILDYLPL